MKICGKQEIFFQAGQVVAFLLGGYLATVNYKYVFFVTLFLIFITIIQAFSFQEPHVKKDNISNKSIKTVLANQILQSVKVIKDNKKVGFFIIFSQIIIAFGTSLFYYMQNFLKLDGYNEFFIGVVFSLSAIASAITGATTFKLEKVIKEKGILMIMPFLSVSCIWFIALSDFHYIFFIFISAIEGFIFVAISDYINKLIPSKNRVTILSLASMVFSFFMIFIFPIIGKIGDVYSLKIAFLLLAIISTFFAIGNFILLIVIENKKQIYSLNIFIL